MSVKEDFIGFTFNNKHSSDFNIVRTSDGSRFNTNLLPSFSDRTIATVGRDETMFFGSNYTQKPFNINIAFDKVTETNFRALSNWIGEKKPCKLIYDETPYKYYMVKISGTPTLKFICFDENEERIYKGEGTLSFVCYDNYAKSVFKYSDEYNINDYSNKNEWLTASGIKAKGTNDTFINGQCPLYNAGDIEAYFKLKIPFINSSIGAISLDIETDTTRQLNIREITKKGNDSGVYINTKNQLIEGYDENGNITGTIYNSYITSGNFFKIPLGISKITTALSRSDLEIEYDYLYY